MNEFGKGSSLIINVTIGHFVWEIQAQVYNRARGMCPNWSPA